MKNPNSYNYRNPSPIEYDDNDSDDEDESPHQKFTGNGNFYNNDDDPNSKRHPKKRKLESFVSNNYERETWSEEETFVLLEVWGERYMELGRRSLRAEDWAELTEKVMEMGGGGIERTEGECRTQLDLLKNKYKKERAKVESGHGSKWAFFKKMDVLLNTRTRGYIGLGCGVDAGEYVFMNPRVYLDRSNVLDEMRDSPVPSDEDSEDDDDDEVGGDEDSEDGESAKLLADSIKRFGDIYEKIEERKRKQMVELENMRQDFQRDLELQKKQIVERAQAEIARIREMDGDDEDEDDDDDNTDTSVENLGD